MRIPEILGLLCIVLTACGGGTAQTTDQNEASGVPAEPSSTSTGGEDDGALGLSNEGHLSSGLITGGAPDRAALEAARDRGVTTVISLRTMEEPGAADEQPMVEELGMTFVSIPIDGAAGLTEDNARAVDEAITDPESGTILHCASSNRVGALVALRAFFVQGVTRDDAMALGREAGLTRLEEATRAAMDAHCEANADAAGC